MGTELIENNIDFDRSMRFVLAWEGGYSNNHDDPGGETNFGISKRAYPDLDIKNLTLERAKEIYHRDYWLKAGCHKYGWPINLIIFDTAVNMGVKAAEQFLLFSEDWVHFLFMRIERYCRLARKNPQFLRGWLNRVVDLFKTVSAERTPFNSISDYILDVKP